MTKTSREEFFESLDAPLRDRSGWGGVRHQDRTVFLCCWVDDIDRTPEGKRVVRLQNPEKHPNGSTGSSLREVHFRERHEHIDLVCVKGYRCFVVFADPSDPSAWVREIETSHRSIFATAPIDDGQSVSKRLLLLLDSVDLKSVEPQ